MYLELDLSLSVETRAFIENEAARRNVPASLIVSEVLTEALEDYYREPTKAEILDSIRIALEESLRGETVPVGVYG